MIGTAAWLGYRYFGSVKRFFNLTTSLSVIGMAIGVASLVVSMAVFSGYNVTLEKTVQDAVGHLLVMKRGSADQTEMLEDIRPVVKGLIAETPFVYAEALLAHGGQIAGVLIEGIEQPSVHKVLNLKDRLQAGSFDLNQDGVVIGKAIAERFSLKLGDEIRLVIPLAQEGIGGNGFRPRLGKFQVRGIINYGRYDFDSRYIVMDLARVQQFAELGQRITGYRLKVADPSMTRSIAQEIQDRFEGAYWARDWQEVNRNLFEAARLEKFVLFVVLMILVVAAAFNIANTLFVSVVRRYRDISVLKTIGATDLMIRQIFAAQGLIVGGVGAISGVILGLGLCQVVEWAQVRWKLIPAEVYKLDHIDLVVQWSDLLAIVGVSLFVCFLATVVPSRKGAKISPVEGLRYE